MKTRQVLAIALVLAATGCWRAAATPYAEFDQYAIGYTHSIEFAQQRVMPLPQCGPSCDAFIVAFIERSNPIVDAGDVVAAKFKCHDDQAKGLRPAGAEPCPAIVEGDPFILELGLETARAARRQLEAYLLTQGVLLQ